jgi:hypothetical protein
MVITNEMNIRTGEVYRVSVKYVCNRCGIAIEQGCTPSEHLPQLQGQEQVEATIRYLSSVILNAWNNPRCLEVRKKVLVP